MRLMWKKSVSVGLVGSFLLTWVNPSFALRPFDKTQGRLSSGQALRGPQNKEVKKQRAGLEDALRAPAGNFLGGVASRATAGLEEHSPVHLGLSVGAGVVIEDSPTSYSHLFGVWLEAKLVAFRGEETGSAERIVTEISAIGIDEVGSERWRVVLEHPDTNWKTAAQHHKELIRRLVGSGEESPFSGSSAKDFVASQWADLLRSSSLAEEGGDAGTGLEEGSLEIPGDTKWRLWKALGALRNELPDTFGDLEPIGDWPSAGWLKEFQRRARKLYDEDPASHAVILRHLPFLEGSSWWEVDWGKWESVFEAQMKAYNRALIAANRAELEYDQGTARLRTKAIDDLKFKTLLDELNRTGQDLVIAEEALEVAIREQFETREYALDAISKVPLSTGDLPHLSMGELDDRLRNIVERALPSPAPGQRAGLEEPPYLISGEDYRGPVAIVGKGGGTTIGFQAATFRGLLKETLVSGVTVKNPGIDTQEQILNRIADSIGEIIDRFGSERVMYVNISFPGFYLPDGSLFRDQDNVSGLKAGLHMGRELTALLAKRYRRPSLLGPIPVMVVHDGTGHANGERSVFGRFPGADDLFFIAPGTGIATRRILRGEPFLGPEGVNYLANEVPHQLIFNGDPQDPDYRLVILETHGDHPDFASPQLPDGQPNPFYRKEDLEDRASGPGIARCLVELMSFADPQAGALMADLPAPIRIKIREGRAKKLTSDDLDRITERAGDLLKEEDPHPLVLKAVKGRGRELGIGLAVSLVEFNRIWPEFTWPPHIVLGGGVAQLGDIYFEAVKGGFQKRLARYASEEPTRGIPDVDDLVGRLVRSDLPEEYREALGGLPTEVQVEEHLRKLSAAGLEEPAGRLAEKVVFVVFPGSSFGAALQKLDAETYMVVTSPSGANEQVKRGVPLTRLIVVLSSRHNRADYETVSRGVDPSCFVEVDPSELQWQSVVLRHMEQQLSRGREIVPIFGDYDASLLEQILNSRGVGPATIREVIQAGLKEAEYLEQMR